MASDAARHMRWQLQRAILYANLARIEKAPARSGQLEELSRRAREQAGRWAVAAHDADPDGGRVRLGARNQLLVLAARLFGVTRIAGVLALGELRTQGSYTALAARHELVQGSKQQGATLARLGGGHDVAVMTAGTNLRAAVLGVNDGLVSNFSIIMGVVGGSADPVVILLAGVASLVAGAFSMAAGEYISVKSQREVTEKLIAEERAALELWPEAQVRELSEVYISKGLTAAEAGAIAARIAESPGNALDTKLRERFGVDQHDLGSPIGAALYSMIAFIAGAAVPLIPFAVAQGAGLAVVIVSVAASALALALVGGGLALTSRVNPLWGAARMLLIGGVSAAVTFGIGSLLGVTLG